MPKTGKKRLLEEDTHEVSYVTEEDPEPTTSTGQKFKRIRTNRECNTGNWEEWTVDDMADELENYGLPEVAKIFKAKGISGDQLSKITERSLDEMGIRNEDQLKTLKFCKTAQQVTKVFNDPIHGHIELHPLCVNIIDTPQFQRLRNIKQLGACYFVYPGASHNRFEHSIGVSYLAGEMTRAIHRRQPELGISEVDILCLEIAGLCHDLGHGPFSHLFDQSFIPKVRPDSEWKHEQASLEMFDFLIEDNELDDTFRFYGLGEDDKEFIKNLIDDKNPNKDWESKGRGEEKSFLFEIVANKRNGIDVDKWDYFARDCQGLGISNNFDHSRYIKFARVLEVDGQRQICSRDKEASNLYGMFHTRANLHKRAYQHPVNKSVAYMITEALEKANEHVKFQGKRGQLKKMSEAIDDMVAYSRMTDCVLGQILMSVDPNLKESQEILKRIYKRELYKCVGQSEPERDITKTEKQYEEELRDIIKKDGSKDVVVAKDDFFVKFSKFNYGMNKDNPVDKVWFYSKKSPDEPIRIRKEQVSYLLPHYFSEKILLLYTRSQDKPVMEKLEKCFRKMIKPKTTAKKGGGPVGREQECTPEKGEPQKKRQPPRPRKFNPDA